MLQLPGPFYPVELEYRRERMLRDYPRASSTDRPIRRRRLQFARFARIRRLAHGQV